MKYIRALLSRPKDRYTFAVVGMYGCAVVIIGKLYQAETITQVEGWSALGVATIAAVLLLLPLLPYYLTELTGGSWRDVGD